jgi:hypothetical protein
MLTHADVQNYGPELVDFAQRAAAQTIAPQLAALEQQNAELRQRVARESRHRLDRLVESAIPSWRQIDSDPRWHQWLLSIDALSGHQRQQLLNEAIAAADAGRVIAFFRGFLNQNAVDGGRLPAGRERFTPAPPGVDRLYTRAQIAAAYEGRRKGRYTEQEWQRVERDIIDAARTGRVLGAEDVSGGRARIA